VAIDRGGLASSSTAVRAWRRGERRLHHIVDPRSGDVAPAYWTLVSATGASCVDANAASTAAVVWGRDAPARVAALGQSARLVAADGSVTRVGGWPAEAPPTGASTPAARR
jgi:thiamine biosynthesis lipoprotein